MQGHSQAGPETYRVRNHVLAAISCLGIKLSSVTPRHLCRPGNLTSLMKVVQSKKALLAVYLSEGGVASLAEPHSS